MLSILVQFNFLNALKCKEGWGMSSRTTDVVTYNYADSTDCAGTNSATTVGKSRGCYVYNFNNLTIIFYKSLY